MQLRKTRLRASMLAVLATVSAIFASTGDETVKRVFAGKLANVPGHALSAEVVEYPPGGKSTVHHHAGSVFAYVLSGRIRSQNSATGAARVYQAGESFFEPAGSDHLVSENASASEPAKLLAVHVAKDGEVLTNPGHAK